MLLLENGFFAIPLSIDLTGKKTKRRISEYKNAFVLENILSRFIMDGLGRYTIKGLPDTVRERVVLQSLLWYGRVCFFEKNGALLALPCAPSGAGMNVYGDFGSGFIYSANGQLSEQVKLYIHGSDKSAFLAKTNGATPDTTLRGVLVRENAIMYPFIRICMQFAEAVADTYRTLDTVRTNLKRPFTIVCEESVIPTVEKYLEERELNYDNIISSGVFPPDKVQMLPIDINGRSLTDTTQLIEWYEGQFRMLCGKKTNSQMDKKGENLTTSEISINSEYAEFSVDKALQYIQEDLDDVNRIFGTSLSVARVESDVKESTDEDLQRNLRNDNN